MNLKLKGHEGFINRLQDQLRMLGSRGKVVVTSFLSPAEQEIAKAIAGKRYSLSFWGGYEEAERKVCFIDKTQSDAEYRIAILESEYDPGYGQLKHPDLLGALLGLGIEREQLGDICIDDKRITIFVKEQMADYVMYSLIQAKRTPLHFVQTETAHVKEGRRKEIKINCASLRMDAVTAALAHTSRKNAMAMIRQGYVKLNDIVLEDNAALCNNDFVSIRRTGRFKFSGVEKTTRKDRLILKFEHYQ